MGGLRFKMPKTFLTFGIGWLAICGIPPLSGFFSKDEILWRAFSSPQGSTLLWGLGTLTAVMTAFYMTRLFSLTFLGELRTTHSKENGHGHGVHESPPTMVIPLQILAGLSVVGGFIGIPHWSWLEHWLEPVIPEHEALAASVNSGMEWVLMGVSVLGAALGIGIALSLYRDLKKIKELENQFSFLHRLLENKWYVDEIYQVVLVKPIQKLCFFLWKQFDVAFLDRIIVGLGRVSVWTGETIRLIQTGSLQFYALILLFGLAAATGYLIYG